MINKAEVIIHLSDSFPSNVFIGIMSVCDLKILEPCTPDFGWNEFNGSEKDIPRDFIV